jgi:O-antigen/teichoic acid export membrane protein
MTQHRNTVGLYAVNATSSVATRVIQLTVLVWTNQYLLRRIEPQEFSLFPVVMSLVFFADVFKNIFTGGLGRYIVEADARGDDDGVSSVVSSMLPFLLGVAATIAAAGSLAAWHIETLINVEPAYVHDARMMLLLLTGLLSLQVATSPFAQGLYVRQQFVRLNLLDLSSEVLRLSMLVMLLFGVSTRVLWLVVASVTAGVVNIALRVVMTRKLMPAIRFRRELMSLDTARTLTSFGAWTSIQGVTDLVSNTAPALILNRYGTPLDVASFHLGRLPDVQTRRITAAAMVPAQPALTSLYAIKGEGALNDLYYRGGRYHLWLTLLVILPFVAYGSQMVQLYVGSDYASAATVMLALLVIYPFLWASAMFYRTAHASGNVRAYYLCEIVVQAASLGALVYAVRARGDGAAGAAIAVAISTAALHVLLIWPMGLRLVGGNWKSFFRHTVIPGTVPFAAGLIVCYIFSRSVLLSSWSTIGLGWVLGVAAYVAVLSGFCLEPTDRDFIRRTMGKSKALAAGRLSSAAAAFRALQ